MHVNTVAWGWVVEKVTSVLNVKKNLLNKLTNINGTLLLAKFAKSLMVIFVLNVI